MFFQYRVWKKHYDSPTLKSLLWNEVTLFYLSNGNVHLQAHLNQISQADSNECPLWSLGKLNRNHVTVSLELEPDAGKSEIVKVYWSALYQIAKMPRMAIIA